MKFISRTLAAFLLILPALVCVGQASQNPQGTSDKQAKAEEIIQLTHTDQLMQRVMAQMNERMKNQAAQQAARMNLNAEQKAAFDDYEAKLNQLLTSAVNWEKMKPIMVRVYAETYTVDELDGILKFYRSPAGQSMVAKSPELMSKTMTLMMQQMSTLQPQIEQLTKDLQSKIQKAAPTAPAK
ncbi:MAG TPA: DUF2059 domain-containing protein [Edaphobacter sp.]|nr:DUF2059 domain-containing protein [Edaphobacter sp.]